MSNKPNVIILGGCGFIGRNLVEYLIENDFVSKLRIVDKVSPQLAWLSEKHKKIFQNSKVEFISGNLIHSSTCDLIFCTSSNNNNNNSEENGVTKDDITWEYVINCAAETRFGLVDEIYKEGIFNLSLNCATAAARYGILKYIELSTSELLCSGSKHAIKETDEVESWSVTAKYKLDVEKALSEIPGLNYIIIRPGVVYGSSDKKNIVQRLVIGAIYKHLNESIQLFGKKDLPMNTVHVLDLCRAIWFILTSLPTEQSHKQLYNIVDTGNTAQYDVMNIISDIFSIPHEYVGKIVSSYCKYDAESAVVDINDKHMPPWTQLCQIHKIDNTPLSPYISKDLLVIKPIHLDNSKLLKTGFKFEVLNISQEKVQEVLDEYIEMGLFPGELNTKF